jgi:hypothetical protein
VAIQENAIAAITAAWLGILVTGIIPMPTLDCQLVYTQARFRDPTGVSYDIVDSVRITTMSKKLRSR